MKHGGGGNVAFSPSTLKLLTLTFLACDLAEARNVPISDAGVDPAVPSWACAFHEQANPGEVTKPKAAHRIRGHELLRSSATLQKTLAADGELVQAVDGDSLTQLLETRERNILIAFYAPWCPHCKEFVLEGARPPIEILNEELQKLGGPQVVKFDVTAGKIPSGFKMEFVPTVFLQRTDGVRLVYTGQPKELDHLVEFAMGSQPEGGLAKA
mmetsp:Transcript_55594/g.120017  ORF Transcript_55594/g.120017 Transcript_55594/m.120017 type:complete len:212 (-) Transcript_55594:28-663(-)